MVRWLPLAVLVTACGSSTPEASSAQIGTGHGAETVPLRPPGSRLSLSVPAGLTRVPHSLRFHDEERGFAVVVSDATVTPGRERMLVESYISRIQTTSEAQATTHRPVNVRGHEGVELTVNGESDRLRVLMVWHRGAVARLAVRHRPDDARAAERVLDSIRFDPDAAVDPLAALELIAPAPEGLTLLPVSNEQLLFRRTEGVGEPPNLTPTSFPSADAVLDVVFVPFAEGHHPSDDRTRGQLLGSRFAGLELAPPEVAPVPSSAFAGYQLVTSTTLNGRTLMLYGAYLEGASGAFLVRGSVAADRSDTWQPRFEALVRWLRPQEGAPTYDAAG